MRLTYKPTIKNTKAAPLANTQQPVEDKKHGLVRVVRQIVLEPFTDHPILVTTTTTGLPTIKPKHLSLNYHLIAAANGVKDISLQRPFYIFASDFSRKAISSLKHIEIAPETEPPTVIHAICTEPRRRSRLGTPQRAYADSFNFRKLRYLETLPPYTTSP